ncbi:hypothetical protein EB796_017227 [Bugula neritina]|uniref:Chitin-binding type-2 domain-containing protein n=1 Tax=Bugula neritina TaxID=10212 RepID=A0A7J7JDV1_BUGNE|nr:hypothetical protein EB796_017227 [Bugula neritina]
MVLVLWIIQTTLRVISLWYANSSLFNNKSSQLKMNALNLIFSFLIIGAILVSSPSAGSPIVDQQASCSQNGNTYKQLPGTGCRKFTQGTVLHPPQVHSCPYGTMFDVKTCVCNWPRNTVCHV